MTGSHSGFPSDATRVCFRALPLRTVLAFTACLLVACSSEAPVDPPAPPTNVACGDLQTGLEGGGVPATLSATGLFVAFGSNASDLVPSDANGATDAFRVDLSGLR